MNDEPYNDEPDPVERELDEPCSLCPNEEACIANDACLKTL